MGKTIIYHGGFLSTNNYLYLVKQKSLTVQSFYVASVERVFGEKGFNNKTPEKKLYGKLYGHDTKSVTER